MTMLVGAVFLSSARGNFAPFCGYVLIESQVEAVEESWIFN
jgi:hypothetical protein